MKNLIFIFLIIISFISCSQNNTDNMKNFEKISWQDIDQNIIKLIGKDWMLICAGDSDNYNMMTASWGQMGWLWEKPVSTIYIRPQRHTHNFTENNEYYTLTFFNQKDKDVLSKMGTVSGANFDKMNYDKLTSIITPNGSVAFEEAELIIECKKIYKTILNQDNFIDKNIIDSKYPDKDFHTVYTGEILNVWRKK